MSGEGGDLPSKRLAENVRRLREAAGMSQAQIAGLMTHRGFKWHQATVFSVEKGERRVDVDELAAIARIFNTNPSVMLRPPVQTEDSIVWDELADRYRRAADRLVSAARQYDVRRQELIDWRDAALGREERGQWDQPRWRRILERDAASLISAEVGADDLGILSTMSQRDAARRQLRWLDGDDQETK